MEPFIGEVRAFGFSFLPAGWAYCNGQLLAIRQNTTLFSLLGTQFGGDGASTFGLPNLMGNLAMGAGQPTGGSNWSIGQFTGSAAVQLSLPQLPMHNHNIVASGSGATSQSSVGNQIALASVESGDGSVDAMIYTDGSPNTLLNQQTLSMVGGNGSHPNTMPSLAISICMALVGTYPYFD